MGRRRKVHVRLKRDASQDDAAMALRAANLPWVTLDFRVSYPPGTPRQTLLQAIGDVAVKACAQVLADSSTQGPSAGSVVAEWPEPPADDSSPQA
jgi:hypothetical protein